MPPGCCCCASKKHTHNTLQKTTQPAAALPVRLVWGSNAKCTPYWKHTRGTETSAARSDSQCRTAAPVDVQAGCRQNICSARFAAPAAARVTTGSLHRSPSPNVKQLHLQQAAAIITQDAASSSHQHTRRYITSTPSCTVCCSPLLHRAGE